MAAGVRAAKHDVISFFDADIVGLTNKQIDLMVLPVLSGEYGMFTLIRDRWTELVQNHMPTALNIGGERTLRRELWHLVPVQDRQGYRVELALNHYALEAGMRIGGTVAYGLGQVVKEVKRGWLLGIWMRLGMMADCAAAFFKLHVFRMSKAA